LQDDCGKIIKKLLNHLAIIVLRIQKALEFDFSLRLSACVFDFAVSQKLAALIEKTALHFSTKI
jgi:hypothetical protein